MDWEKVLRELVSLSDEEFQLQVVQALAELTQLEAKNLRRRLEVLKLKLQRYLMCGC